MLVEGVNHGLGDGFTFHLNQGRFFVSGCLGGVVVGECPSIMSFLGVKVPMYSGGGASGHGKNVSG